MEQNRLNFFFFFKKVSLNNKLKTFYLYRLCTPKKFTVLKRSVFFFHDTNYQWNFYSKLSIYKFEKFKF